MSDLEYRIVVATCYMRLNRFKEAYVHLQYILQNDPKNKVALYYMSYCQNAQGNKKTAIEELTKVGKWMAYGLVKKRI